MYKQMSKEVFEIINKFIKYELFQEVKKIRHYDFYWEIKKHIETKYFKRIVPKMQFYTKKKKKSTYTLS